MGFDSAPGAAPIYDTAGDLGVLRHESWAVELPLRARCVDQLAALAGAGSVEPGGVKATYGTGVFVLAHVGEELRHDHPDPNRDVPSKVKIALALPGGSGHQVFVKVDPLNGYHAPLRDPSWDGDAVACGDDAKHGKPHPDLYQVALEKLGLAEPARAMAVGDSVYDVIAAKALGLQVTGLLTGGFSREDLTSAGCELVLSDVKHLAAHLVRN